MRMLGIVCACAAIGPLVAARAEPRRTLEDVTLRKKPGERAAAVGQLPAHTEVTVIGQDGRWLLVRASGATGYLTRTTVSSAAVVPAPISGWRQAAGTRPSVPSAPSAVEIVAVDPAAVPAR